MPTRNAEYERPSYPPVLKCTALRLRVDEPIQQPRRTTPRHETHPKPSQKKKKKKKKEKKSRQPPNIPTHLDPQLPRLRLPPLVLLRIQHLTHPLPPLPRQMPPHTPRHSRMHGIADRTHKAEEHHDGPHSQTDAAVAARAGGAAVAFGLAEGGGCGGGVEAGGEHEEGGEEHHGEEAEGEREGDGGVVAPQEEVGVQGGDGVEEGEAGDEEGLEYFGAVWGGEGGG